MTQQIVVNIRLLERDKRVLEAISKVKMLTVNQIYRKFFSNSQAYCYERMKKLEKAGYVVSRPYVDRYTGRKIGVCYYLTPQGFSVIGKEHYNPWKLINTRKQDYRVALNELYVQLSVVGWEYQDSREVKETYNLNRGMSIGCTLTRDNLGVKQGKEVFGVYLLQAKRPREDTIDKVQAEIAKNESMINNVIVLHNSDDNNVVYSTGDGHVRWTEHLGVYRLYMMRYERGLELLKYMVDPDYILKPPFKTTLDEIGATYVKPEYGVFSDHVIHYGGRNCRLLELCSNNLTDIYHLKNYNLDEAKAKDRLVVALIPEGEKEYWREEFKPKYYPHIKFFSVKLEN